MTGLGRDLPKRAWLRIYRVTGTITLISVALSVIFTNVIMEMFSAGINVQGLVVSILMPLALGGPMTWFLVLKHEQLRHANDQLEHIASTDWLTACLNRGAFTGAVSRHLDRRTPTGSGGALLIVDADDFKSVNDRFGHEAGDEALQLMARAIRSAVRGSDPATADRVAERIRASVAAIAFAPGGTPCPLSVSIGGATYAAQAPFGELYRLADQHLYAAKNTGRDRVTIMQAA